MFLELTLPDNKKMYVNENEIRKFAICNHNPNLTYIDLQYGTLLVKQRPEEMMEMLKGEN